MQKYRFARYSKGSLINIHQLEIPFSNYKFIKQSPLLTNLSSVKRIFSQVRRSKCKTMLVEEITPQGALKDEINLLKQKFPGIKYTASRFTFWKTSFSTLKEFQKLRSSQLYGYMIFLNIEGEQNDLSHVFESIIPKYNHIHNFIPNNSTLKIKVLGRKLSCKGVMYCQQNMETKVCAHVALRSLLLRIKPEFDFYYSEIQKASQSPHPPSKGLDTNAIRNVLNHFGVNYFDLDFISNKLDHKKFPFSKWLYSGIENGFGGLLGFQFKGPGSKSERHIIPFFGHTFNQDTWAPRAGNAYFRIGANTSYFSSEDWISSFIGHDDNFGSNFCVPKGFIEPGQAKYVAALMPDNLVYDGIIAELCAIDALYSTFQNLKTHNPNDWLTELYSHTESNDIVLRTIYISNSDYENYLKSAEDWYGNKEYPNLVPLLGKVLPESIWMVELSVPELFSTNYRKIGEIILDAKTPPDIIKKGNFTLARFPENIYINKGLGNTFLHIRSNIKAHTPVYSESFV